MKPRNKKEVKFLEISNRFTKQISTQDKNDLHNWAYEKLTDKLLLFSHKYVHYCSECNHSWRDNIQHSIVLKKNICPNCDITLLACNNSRREITQANSFYKVDVFEKHQMVRIFNVKKYFYKRRKPIFHITEVVRHFVEDNGGIVTFALKGGMGSGYYGEKWQYTSGLEPRCRTYGHINRCNISFNNLYPKIKVKSIFKKHGFRTSFHGVKPHELFNKLITNNKFETLFKLNQFGLINSGYNNLQSIYNVFWRTILLCIKNNYIIKDANSYIDYLNLLTQFEKDVKSPKYIFPENLHKEHNRYVNKSKNRIRKKNLLNLKDKMKKDNKIYVDRIKKYENLVIKKDNIVISPIKSVFEVEEEGTELNHCLFIMNYHNMKNSLLLSAKVNGNRTETIEFNLKDRIVIQSKGLNNTSSVYHSQILKLMNNNINLIK